MILIIVPGRGGGDLCGVVYSCFNNWLGVRSTFIQRDEQIRVYFLCCLGRIYRPSSLSPFHALIPQFFDQSFLNTPAHKKPCISGVGRKCNMEICIGICLLACGFYLGYFVADAIHSKMNEHRSRPSVPPSTHPPPPPPKKTDGLYCLMQHLAVFHDQSLLDKSADFGEPCEKCKHAHECDFNWLEKIIPFCNATGIRIKLVHSAHLEKQ